MKFYIRTREGETFYVETLQEALTILVGPNGYRLTISDGPVELVIRAGDWQLDKYFPENNVTDVVALMVRGL